MNVEWDEHVFEACICIVKWLMCTHWPQLKLFKAVSIGNDTSPCVFSEFDIYKDVFSRYFSNPMNTFDVFS